MAGFTIDKTALLLLLSLSVAGGCGQHNAGASALPTVIFISPLNGSASVAFDATVSAGFSSAMAPATINAATFTLAGPGGVAVAGAVSYSGTVAVFTPSAALAANSIYVATVTT